jgi:hypothetical protein
MIQFSTKAIMVLLWKNFILLKRSKISTLLEITLPTLFVIILIPIRMIVKSESKLNDTCFNEFFLNKFHHNLIIYKNSYIGYNPNNSLIIKNIMDKVGNKLNLDTKSKF